MNNYILVEDYVLIESFIKISYAIESLYHKLYMLEIKEQKESDEYKRYLGYLEMTLEYEEEVYKESNLNAFKCRNLIDLIINRYINKKMINDIESVLTRKYENAYLRRVVNKLNNIMKNDYYGMKELIIGDAFNIGSNVDFEYIYFKNMINNNFMNDFIERILVLLYETMDKTNDTKLKNKLIRDKYFIAFVFPNCEKDLMNNRFNIDDKICDNTALISYLSGLQEDIYQQIKKDYLQKETRKLFYKTLVIESKEKVNKDKMLLREIFVRALFMMMDKNSIRELMEEINKVSNTNCDNIKSLFNNCCSLTEEDKKKQITLKLW